MGKEIATQVQETQSVPNRKNPMQNTPRQLLIKLTKIKHKNKYLKQQGKKNTINPQGDPYKDDS